MAAAFDPTELKTLLECGICLNRFQDPRVLPCLHSYCLECLKSHISSSKDKEGAFNCPQCREKCLVPDGGADKYPKNFFVNTMKDVLPESLLQEPSQEAAEPPGSIMCTLHDKKSDDGHGEAVTFCVQCDAHYCQLCAKQHETFAKDHKVMVMSDKKDCVQSNGNPCCESHGNFSISWYCKSCSLPACCQCLLEKHDGHESETMLQRNAALKQDMLNVSKMASKRLEYLQKVSAEVKENEKKTQEELDKVSSDISDTADNLCALIRQLEAKVQDQIEKAKNVAKKHFKKASEELQTTQDNLLSLASKVTSLHQASDEQALSTVLQATMIKQQFLYQLNLPLSFVQLSLNKQLTQSETTNQIFIGSFDRKVSTEPKNMIQAEDVVLGEPLCTTKLEYTGSNFVCSITPIHESAICVAHYSEKDIWVYAAGELQQKMAIPGIKAVTGMVALDSRRGKVALVDNKESRVHFVTVSKQLTVEQHVTSEVPIRPDRISKGLKKELIVSSSSDLRVVHLSYGGRIMSETKLALPYYPFGVQQTTFGYVVPDRSYRYVHFTNNDGQTVHQATTCTSYHVLGTSLGHVLVADRDGCCIKVYSESGDFLGETPPNSIDRPYFMNLNEAEGLMYVGGGDQGQMELRTYKFAPGDLPLLPAKHNVTDVIVDVNLAQL